MMELQEMILPEEENDFTLKTNDFLRPHLKQIGNSVFDIKEHFTPGSGFHIVPSISPANFGSIQSDLLAVLKQSNFLSEHDIITGRPLEDPADHTKGRGFIFFAESLALALAVDLPHSPRPDNVKCDVFIALPHQPLMVITLVDGDSESVEAVCYNTAVASRIIIALGTFTNECINPVCGVLDKTDLKNGRTFKANLELFVKNSSLFVTVNSLLMSPERYEKILTGFWAGVAETKSVVSASGQVDPSCLRFLTKEQCIVLVENISNREVKVSCQPGCGATTLALEVTRRLSRLDDTVMVCESDKERDKLRNGFQFSSMQLTCNFIGPGDLEQTDFSQFEHIVDMTGSVQPHISGSLWQFNEVGPAKTDYDRAQRDAEETKTTGTEDTYLVSEIRKKSIDNLESEPLSKEVRGMTINPDNIGADNYLTSAESATVRETVNDPKFLFPDTGRRRTQTHSSGNQTSQLLGNVIKEDEKTLSLQAQISYLERGPPMKMDTSRVNTNYCHLSGDGKLVNMKDPTPQNKPERFKNYWGTCGSPPISLPRTSTVFAAPHYWETHTRLVVKKRVPVWPLFEMGVCEEGMIDGEIWISRQRRSWAVDVEVCRTHRPQICTKVRGEKEQVEGCWTDTMSPTPGTSAVLRHGIVLDVGRGRVGFIDLDKELVLHTFDVNFTQAIYPMFAVDPSNAYCTIEMKLISGSEITMTDSKKSLINETVFSH